MFRAHLIQNIQRYLLFLIISFGVLACEIDYREGAEYNEPGFFVKDYNLSPLEETYVEAVKVNTPSGFESVSATISDSREDTEKYILTRKSLDNLNKFISPALVDILKQGGIKNIPFTDEASFIEAITNTIGEDNYQKYGKHILNVSTVWSGVPIEKPLEGNEMDGYIRFIYRAPSTEGTAEISLKVTTKDGTEYIEKVRIQVEKKRKFQSIASFLESNPQYDDLLTIAQRSTYWRDAGLVEDENGEMDRLASYGLLSENWPVTFFAVPDGTFKPLIDKSPNATNVQDITVEMADAYIESLILGNKAVLSNGSYTIPYADLGQINPANVLIDIKKSESFSSWGSMAYNLDEMRVGQILKASATREFIDRAAITDTNIIAGSAIIHTLDDHYSDLENLDGNVEPGKTWRGDVVLSALGWDICAKAGMNALTGSRYHGSGHWYGTWFLPTNSTILAAYQNIDFPSSTLSDVCLWGWENRNEIPTDNFNLMTDLWQTHVVESIVGEEQIVDGTYETMNGKSLKIEGNTVSVEGKSAEILKIITYYDGGDYPGPTTIAVIDKILY